MNTRERAVPDPTLQDLADAYRVIRQLADDVGRGTWASASSLYAAIQHRAEIASRPYHTGVKVFDDYQQEIWGTYERWCKLYLRCTGSAPPNQAKQVAAARAKGIADYTDIAIVFMQKMEWTR